MGIEKFIVRVDQLIERANEVLNSEFKVDNHRFVDNELFHSFSSGSRSFLESTFGKDHAYFKEFESSVNNATPHSAKAGLGILVAVRDEMAGGWIDSAKGLVSAEIFADFLEMADHLLEEKYKDAAAVITGSVLEEHLRQLCQKNGIDVEFVNNGKVKPKKADLLNADLAKNAVYNKLDQKNVTAWLDLRNKAAHGKYNEYSIEQVALMLQGVSDFMVRVAI